MFHRLERGNAMVSDLLFHEFLLLALLWSVVLLYAAWP
jgi:hypothetical protein